jgi:glutamine amidotransferase PdxT
MIQILNGNIPFNAYFDMDWKTNRIENVQVKQGNDVLSLSGGEIETIRQLIEEEVTAALLETALAKKAGLIQTLA